MTIRKRPTTRRRERIFALAAEAWGARGGIAQSTRDILEALAKMSSATEIDILPRHAAFPIPVLPSGIRQYTASAGKLRYVSRAVWLSATRRPDIVYCGHAFMAPLAHILARIAGARLVSHVHGLEVWQPLSGAVRRGLAAADLVLCVSHHTANKVADTAGVDPARCAVIYNTIGEHFVPGDRSAARLRFDIPSDAVVLSTVSRLDPGQRHKGHDQVIPLLADLAIKVPGLVYLVGGTGGDRDRLEALARDNGVSDIVRFLGFVPDEDLPDLYRASDLYVMPSHGEGFGIAFVEAMACGTQALGLDEGGAGDALRNGELGRAVAYTDFPATLSEMLLAPPPDRADLAARTQAIFGKPRFQARLEAATAPLIAYEHNQESPRSI